VNPVTSPTASSETRRAARARLTQVAIWGGRLALGYVVAVAAGAVVFAALLHLAPNFEAPHLPHSSTTVLELMIICFVLGLIFGMPYTIVGSLSFWFLLPHKTAIFLLIGTLCPTAALFTMWLTMGQTLWWDREMAETISLSLPAGLLATYFYGAIGFGQGFRRWRFQ